MKIAARPSFWSLRPITAARRLELSCWLAAALLAVGLALAPAPGARADAARIAPSAASLAGQQAIYQRCVEKILASVAGSTEEYVAREINQLCIDPLGLKVASAALRTGPSCRRLLPVRLTPLARPLGGCLD